MVVINHKASSKPNAIIGVHFPNTSGNSSAMIMLEANAQRIRTHRSGTLDCFQRAIGPNPIITTKGTMMGTNTALK